MDINSFANSLSKGKKRGSGYFDINSFALGFSMGKKRGGGSAVLTELTVTENGVYDEPVIGGGTVEIAVGKTVTFKPTPTLDDIPAEYIEDLNKGQSVKLYNDANTNWMVIGDSGLNTIAIMGAPQSAEAAENAYPVYLNEESVPSLGAPYGITEAGWWAVYTATQTVEKLDTAPSITIENADTINVLTDFKNFFQAPSTPADGWNKVTVNVACDIVAGDIVDVDELPTENVDEEKIYRVAEYAYTTSIYLNDGTSVATLEERLDSEIGEGGYIKGAYTTVDVLPNPSELPPPVGGTIPVYVLRETGEPFIYINGERTSVIDTANQVFQAFLGYPEAYSFQGIADDKDSITEVGYYTVFEREVVGATYGIPDKKDNKTVFEHNGSEWVKVYHPTFETLDATANGAYTPDEADGYSSVNVNVVDTTLASLLQAGATNITELSLLGVTELRSYAFAYSEHPIRTLIAPDLKKIGAKAFIKNQTLAITSLPDGVTEIGESAFSYCYKLALSSLPEGLIKIGPAAFDLCYLCTFTSLPSTLTFVGHGAFQYCEGLTTITFNSKPTTLGAGAFHHCSNLTDIYVPWAEGEVPGAPWDATNATIHYNYTGG